MTAFPSAVGRTSFRWRLLAAGLLLAGLAAALPATGRTPMKFEVGLARSCFPNVNLNDAVAAYRALLENIGQRRGYDISPEVTIYEDTAQFVTAIKHGTLHLAVMDTWQFLTMEGLREIRPYFATAINGQLGRRYLVVVRRGSGIRTVADLRDRAVVRLESVNNGVCRSWLETLLPDDPASPSSAFFESLENAAKPMAVVLPVFFGKKAGCIVDEGSFNLMKELNPQVGNALEVIAVSDVFVDIIVCLGEQEWPSPEGKVDTVKAIGDLAADPAGRQMLTLFKISGQVPFQEEQLATVRALRRTHAQLRGPHPAGDHPL